MCLYESPTASLRKVQINRHNIKTQTKSLRHQKCIKTAFGQDTVWRVKLSIPVLRILKFWKITKHLPCFSFWVCSYYVLASVQIAYSLWERENLIAQVLVVKKGKKPIQPGQHIVIHKNAKLSLILNQNLTDLTTGHTRWLLWCIPAAFVKWQNCWMTEVSPDHLQNVLTKCWSTLVCNVCTFQTLHPLGGSSSFRMKSVHCVMTIIIIFI